MVTVNHGTSAKTVTKEIDTAKEITDAVNFIN